MAFDEVLTERFRDATRHLSGITEKRMMGGVCFLLDGNMLGGADRTQDGDGRFMFRVGKELEAEALSRDGAVIMERRQGRSLAPDLRLLVCYAQNDRLILAHHVYIDYIRLLITEYFVQTKIAAALACQRLAVYCRD